jgi:hypothetical protein
LKGKRFESLEEAQAYLDHWEERWADTRIHGRTKRQVAAVFVEERASLQTLPLEPFRYYQYGQRTVHLDGCVEVEAAYYGAPPGWIGRQVDVQWDAMFVRLLDPRTGTLLREHLSQKRGGHYTFAVVTQRPAGVTGSLVPRWSKLWSVYGVVLTAGALAIGLRACTNAPTLQA